MHYARNTLLVALVAALAVAESVVLSLYVREVGRNADLRVQMEYANGASIIARAQCPKAAR